MQSPTGLPSPDQVIELLADEFTRAGYEIDGVTIDTRSRPPRIAVVADGDTALDLDAIAELSRTASELLDGIITGDQAYILEVTSPGVDRPLTAEKHFRRARGRKVEIALEDSSTLVGRLGSVADGAVDLVVSDRGRLAVRRIALSEIRKAVVQVEFSPPNARELELVGDAAGTSGTEGRS